MFIDGREIGLGCPPYIVAEMSANHAGSLDNALALVRTAKESGADAVKFQALQADRITINLGTPAFMITEGPWTGRFLHDLYKEAETPIEWWEPIMKEAERVGITCFPSVFDIESIPYLEALGCPAYKVASLELNDTELIKALAKTGKPLIISTGVASTPEISAAIQAAYGSEFALLHCVSAYPAPLPEMFLERIKDMRHTYACPIGLSDHTTDVETHLVPIVATALGASIIEKHLMLAGAAVDKTLDAAFSLMPHEFAAMVVQISDAYSTLVPDTLFDSSVVPAGYEHRPLRRSLFAVEDIAEGEIFTKDNVRSIRPGHGLPPSLLPQVLGRRASVAIERGTPLTMELLMKTEAA